MSSVSGLLFRSIESLGTEKELMLNTRSSCFVTNDEERYLITVYSFIERLTANTRPLCTMSDEKQNRLNSSKTGQAEKRTKCFVQHAMRV